MNIGFVLGICSFLGFIACLIWLIVMVAQKSDWQITKRT